MSEIILLYIPLRTFIKPHPIKLFEPQRKIMKSMELPNKWEKKKKKLACSNRLCDSGDPRRRALIYTVWDLLWILLLSFNFWLTSHCPFIDYIYIWASPFRVVFSHSAWRVFMYSEVFWSGAWHRDQAEGTKQHTTQPIILHLIYQLSSGQI